MASPDPICRRCAKPIVSGAACQLAGRPVHIRCLAGAIQHESIKQRDRASREPERAAAAIDEAQRLVNPVRREQTHCSVCGEPFALARSVLFQGDKLVHAGCWRAEPKPLDAPPAE